MEVKANAASKNTLLEINIRVGMRGGEGEGGRILIREGANR